jgi:hypothetical protein
MSTSNYCYAVFGALICLQSAWAQSSIPATCALDKLVPIVKWLGKPDSSVKGALMRKEDGGELPGEKVWEVVETKELLALKVSREVSFLYIHSVRGKVGRIEIGLQSQLDQEVISSSCGEKSAKTCWIIDAKKSFEIAYKQSAQNAPKTLEVEDAKLMNKARGYPRKYWKPCAYSMSIDLRDIETK